jgi:2,4-didehydro-3-deoxy-L-rhamnonate hydrolase
MAVHVVRFEHDGRTQWGVICAGRITPIPGEFPTTADFVRAAEPRRLAALDGFTVAETAVRVLSPLTRNQQFICQGANYRRHMLESGMDPNAKTFNMIFTKASSCIAPADADVVRPAFVRLLDYEVELGLVMKRDITERVRVSEASLAQFIAGLVIVNDYSARDIQIPQTQFYKGKSYRSFGPVGPYLCLLEPADMQYLARLELTLQVNGEVRQRDSTRNMVFGPAETLTELSGVHDLFAGDLISTGTPSGCALRLPSPAKQRIAALLSAKRRWRLFMSSQLARTQYLQPGDIVESRIKSDDGAIDLGLQRNRVIAEA